MSQSTIKALLERIYSAVAELEAMHPGRRFTPDGHTVGSIGEVLAAEKYDLELLPSNTPLHDAVTLDGRRVQIRTTQGNSVPLKTRHEFLIVQLLKRDGTVEEVFNGPGDVAWELARNRQPDGNGQVNIRLNAYRRAAELVPHSQRIPLRNARPVSAET